MANIKFFSGEKFPLEMHKVKIVQKLNLIPIEQRLECLTQAGNNSFLLKNRDVFMDMLTDSGVNAMSDQQLAAMMQADDSYAGSMTFDKLESKIQEILGAQYFLPAHQGRAAENILAESFVTPGSVSLMNFHFTTTKALITKLGGSVEEIVIEEGLNPTSDYPFKGNADIDKLKEALARLGAKKISFVRMESGTNLIGGQPFSLENLRQVAQICREAGVMLILDASLLADNLYFIKVREASCAHKSIREIMLEICALADIVYFSARKLGCARGGGICTNNQALFERMREFVPLFEGFLTYGGMSVREMEAITVGLTETLDEDMISQGPIFIEYMVDELKKRGIPVVTPAGGLGCHLNAMEFVDHIPQTEYRAGALTAAMYLAGGIRGMERGTMSEQRDAQGNEVLSEMELLRLALPRRVFTMSQVKYAVDRVEWLYANRRLIGGLKYIEEPKVLRFFFGRLASTSDWQDKLVAKFRADFGDSL
ncbi:MAG: tryptophanase [Peptococcaceae bacterium]|jgi:tryptophanase|nr:tryptophanase [Peptococcaceae bacterium]